MTTSDLLTEFKRLELTEREGMMLLADSNTISDLCVTPYDIYQGDIEAAVRWLRTYRKP